MTQPKAPSDHSPFARTLRNSGWLFSAKGFGAIAGLFYLAVLTRTLGPAGFGRFILIVSAVQILAALLRLQTWQAVVKFGGVRLNGGDQQGFSQICWWNQWVELGGALIAMALLILLGPSAAGAIGWDAEMTEGLILYGIITLLAVRSTPTGVLRAHDRFRDGAAGDATVPLVRLIGAFAVLFLDPGLIEFLIVWGVSEVAAALVLWGFVARHRLVSAPLLGDSGGPGYLSFLFSTNASNMLSIMRERGAVLVVGLFVSAGAAGLFRLADQLANSINRLTEIFARPLFSELAKLASAGDREGAIALFKKSLKVSALAGAGMFIVLVLLGKPIILLMSGEAFLPAYPLLLILAGATIIALATLGFEPLLQATGHAGTAFVVRLFGLALLGLLFWWLVPGGGVTGASWAMLISAVATAMLMSFAGWRALRKL